MSKLSFYNVIDFGSSKNRITIFNSDLTIVYSETILGQSIEDTNIDNLDLKKVIKNAEKKISSHIDDIILLLDTDKILTIDICLNKNIGEKIIVNKIYNIINLELNHLISNSYYNYEIIHTVISGCIIDGKFYDTLQNEENVLKNIKIEFKLICYPKEILSKVKKKLNNYNLNISKIFCTSYSKSIFYSKKLNFKKILFLEIGLKRSSLIFFENDKLKFIQSVCLGGFHITKDISNIFKISLEDAEKIKKTFNNTNTEFSYNSDHNTDVRIEEILNTKISVDLLKKVILHRVQEIIDLSLGKPEFKNFDTKDIELFLIGEGSILFGNNSFHLKDKYNLKCINFFAEHDQEICRSGLNYFLNNHQNQKKIIKRYGLFEKFFNFFDK